MPIEIIAGTFVKGGLPMLGRAPRTMNTMKKIAAQWRAAPVDGMNH
jgi:hypothetical protein